GLTVTVLLSSGAIAALPLKLGDAFVNRFAPRFANALGLSVTVGELVSTVKVDVLVPVLPALSSCSASAVYSPFASCGPVLPVVHLPPLGMTVSVWAGVPDADLPA